jgi:hypothetical protein
MDKVAEQRALASQLRQMAEKCRHQACRLRLLEVARWFEQDAEVGERIAREFPGNGSLNGGKSL